MISSKFSMVSKLLKDHPDKPKKKSKILTEKIFARHHFFNPFRIKQKNDKLRAALQQKRAAQIATTPPATTGKITP
jgi:hypothetical protein